MSPALEEGLQTCEHMISPGLLKRCRIYRRNEAAAPERCWDKSQSPNPANVGKACPNHTGRRHPEQVDFSVDRRRTASMVNLTAGSVESRLQVDFCDASKLKSQHEVNLPDPPEDPEWEY